MFFLSSTAITEETILLNYNIDDQVYDIWQNSMNVLGNNWLPSEHPLHPKHWQSHIQEQLVHFLNQAKLFHH